jgi:hypothetical protein
MLGELSPFIEGEFLVCVGIYFIQGSSFLEAYPYIFWRVEFWQVGVNLSTTGRVLLLLFVFP